MFSSEHRNAFNININIKQLSKQLNWNLILRTYLKKRQTSNAAIMHLTSATAAIMHLTSSQRTTKDEHHEEDAVPRDVESIRYDIFDGNGYVIRDTWKDSKENAGEEVRIHFHSNSACYLPFVASYVSNKNNIKYHNLIYRLMKRSRRIEFLKIPRAFLRTQSKIITKWMGRCWRIGTVVRMNLREVEDSSQPRKKEEHRFAFLSPVSAESHGCIFLWF